ncbi:hypothetical protein LU699_07920 [Luteimonas fraxinea]|uniref:DUF202 domain-containing protein n=2 Tax=Luteimonas fraxinea TaxID=2901869 RepID=A0ABS8UDN7_9GAMM|nr:hypothetical protein [Luteimonas fraxinea]MCD9097359.1 hypothetical protein [Luteimonas fraxinea]UHH11620.1 hypothetical protein LU699_07920 [Luteimonas fraxinea]
MQRNRSIDEAKRRFTRPMVMVGRCLLLIGAGVLVAIHLFATDGEARDLGRIVGGAVVVAGLLVYGFGLLRSTTRRAPSGRR